MKKAETKDRIKEAMEIREIKQAELVEKTGIDKGQMSSYLSGKYKPKQGNLERIAKVLSVDEAWLMGYDVPMFKSQDGTSNISNIFPIELKRLPLLGEIACGEPKYTNEDRESYVLAGTNIQADFCLRATGDSMINARILDGDIVFIRKQDIVENGEIAAVVVNNESEATLKRVFYYPEQSLLVLRPENPRYEEKRYANGELNEVHILGKAVAFQSDVR